MTAEQKKLWTRLRKAYDYGSNDRRISLSEFKEIVRELTKCQKS